MSHFRNLLRLYTYGLSVLLLIPIFVVIVISFSGEGYLRFPPTSLSFQWYNKVLNNNSWVSSFWYSLTIAVVSSAITVVFAGLAAYGLSRGTFYGKNFILSLLLLPMIIPTIVAAIGMYFVSLEAKIVGNLIWIAACHAVVSLPPVILILLTTLQGIDVNLERAAFSLGYDRFGVFTKVILPLAMPGIVSATFVAFLGSFDEFIISLFIMGSQGRTLPVMIFHSIFYEVDPSIAAVSTLIIGLTAALMICDWLNRRRIKAMT